MGVPSFSSAGSSPRRIHTLNGRVYVFKLGGTAPRPVLDLWKARRLKPPALPLGTDAYRGSGHLYERNRTMCHGVAAVTGVPDLRRSVRLQDAVAWRSAVVDGDLASRGMPRFGKYVTAADAELIRANVAKQAATLYAAEVSSPGVPR